MKPFAVASLILLCSAADAATPLPPSIDTSFFCGSVSQCRAPGYSSALIDRGGINADFLQRIFVLPDQRTLMVGVANNGSNAIVVLAMLTASGILEDTSDAWRPGFARITNSGDLDSTFQNNGVLILTPARTARWTAGTVNLLNRPRDFALATFAENGSSGAGRRRAPAVNAQFFGCPRRGFCGDQFGLRDTELLEFNPNPSTGTRAHEHQQAFDIYGRGA